MFQGLGKKDTKIIIMILILALALRIPHITDAFSGDEIDIVGPARNYVLFGDITAYDACGEKIYNLSHPPVRIILYSSWALVFGYSEIAMRMIPIIFGLLTIIFTYI